MSLSKVKPVLDLNGLHMRHLHAFENINAYASTDLLVFLFFFKSSGEEQEDTLLNQIQFCCPRNYAQQPQGREPTSHRGSMHALSVSHLCICEAQVNKQNVLYHTHTRGFLALRGRHCLYFICLTQLSQFLSPASS
ncbi:hypothetical protein ILYODFUR_021162 [Ilyodon furcidens]|uniref:Uncharacterized protein n=1 Tax=Ilyodon furcidens TaxID=33524 RepID=A0ABV0UIZ1_9TELE